MRLARLLFLLGLGPRNVSITEKERLGNSKNEKKVMGQGSTGI